MLPRRHETRYFFRTDAPDHVSEPDASGLAEKHIRVDLVEAVLRAHPAHQFAIGDARRIFQRPGAADRHEKAFRLAPPPCKTPTFNYIDTQARGAALLDCN